MKIRMMGNPIFVETMNAMGGNGVAMGFNELYSALQTGVVDGAENNPPTVLAQNHYQVGKVYSLTGHLIIPEIFVFSKRTWDTLSKEDQALLKKLSREAQIEQRELWDEKTAKATEAELKAKGVQFVPADKAAFYKATQPIRDKYGAEVRGAAEAHRRHEVAPRIDAARLRAARWSGSTSAASGRPAVAMVVITLIIPYGVFMRYVHELGVELARAARGAADGDVLVRRRRGGCYRANVHIAVQTLLKRRAAGDARRRCSARRRHR